MSPNIFLKNCGLPFIERSRVSDPYEGWRRLTRTSPDYKMLDCQKDLWDSRVEQFVREVLGFPARPTHHI